MVTKLISASETYVVRRYWHHLTVLALVVFGLIFAAVGITGQLSSPEVSSTPMIFILFFVVFHLIAVYIGTYKKRYQAIVHSFAWKTETIKYVLNERRWDIGRVYKHDGTGKKIQFYQSGTDLNGVKYVEQPARLSLNLGVKPMKKSSPPELATVEIRNPQFWHQVNEGDLVTLVVDFFGNIIRAELPEV